LLFLIILSGYSKNAFHEVDGPKFGFGTSLRDDFTASGKRAPGRKHLANSQDINETFTYYLKKISWKL